MKKLLIFRHAEAGQPYDGDDAARTLTSRGEQQAQAVGRFLLERELFPEAMAVSSAMRTRQTSVWINSELGDHAITGATEEELYQASAASLLSHINQTPETVETLFVIAHMPGVQNLTERLANIDSTEDAVLELAQRWPEGSVAIGETSSSWAELDQHDVAIREFFIPEV